jgi:HD-GYP domain-containing protein (c-di-GMP phosphodiesterase class II)
VTSASPTIDPAVDDGAADAPATVSVRAEDLIVGRKLGFPLHDEQEILLLAEGSEITPKFKELLVRRGIKRVRLSAEDCARLTIGGLEAAIAPTLGFLDDLVKPLDAMIDAGALFVANTGTALREQVVLHGCKGYDEAHRREIVEQRRRSAESLDAMLKDAIAGRPQPGANIAAMAATYITQMTRDADCVTSIATEAGSDPALAEHCLRMSILAMSIGVELGLDERNVRDLGLCGLVHDWGMIKVPAELRDADRVLSPAEFLQIKKHPVHSLELLQKVSGLPTVVPLVCYQVHEQPNGEGYPRGRRGNSIHLYARILKVADVYCGMVERRPHRPPFCAYSAVECLVRLSRENAVDPRVVRALLNVTALFPVGSWVQLSDGRVGRVLRRNGEHYTRPIVEILQQADGTPERREGTIVDLHAAALDVTEALPTPGTDEVLLDKEKLVVERT